jgi:hypothetical protein
VQQKTGNFQGHQKNQMIHPMQQRQSGTNLHEQQGAHSSTLKTSSGGRTQEMRNELE